MFDAPAPPPRAEASPSARSGREAEARGRVEEVDEAGVGADGQALAGRGGALPGRRTTKSAAVSPGRRPWA